MRIFRAIVAILILPTLAIAADAPPPKKKPTASRSAIPIASSQATVADKPPVGPVVLRSIGIGSDSPTHNWAVDSSLTASGTSKTVWVLAVTPADKSVGTMKLAATWAQIRVDCTAKSTSALRAAMVDFSGNVVQDMGTMPAQTLKPAPTAAMGKLVAAACGSSLLPTMPANASNAAQAIQWTRNPSLAAAFAPKPAIAAQRPSVTAAKVPSGFLNLVDTSLGIAPFSVTDENGKLVPAWKTEFNYFTDYLQRPLGESDIGSDIWLLKVFREDQSFLDQAKVKFSYSAIWYNFSSECDKSTIRLKQSVMVGSDGKMLTVPVGMAPAQVTQQLLSHGETISISVPQIYEPYRIYRMMCPTVNEMVMGDIWSGQIFPSGHRSATDAIKAARRARNLTAAEQAIAANCLALASAFYQVNRDGTLTRALQEFEGTSAVGQRLSLTTLIRAALNNADVQAMIDAATPGKIAFIRSAASSNNTKAIKAEFNKCLSDLPLGAALNQFK